MEKRKLREEMGEQKHQYNKNSGLGKIVIAYHLDEIEEAMKAQKEERAKRAKLEAFKRARMLKAQKLTIRQLKNLQKHTKFKIYATKKRIWEGKTAYL